MDVDKPKKRVFSFLEQVARETNVSKGKAHLELVGLIMLSRTGPGRSHGARGASQRPPASPLPGDPPLWVGGYTIGDNFCLKRHQRVPLRYPATGCPPLTSSPALRRPHKPLAPVAPWVDRAPWAAHWLAKVGQRRCLG